MGRQAFDRKLAELETLRREPASGATLERLRKALKDRNNYFVSKAAALTGDLRLHALEPDLLAAFDRFLVNAVKSDPQCWAKNAIAKALKDLDHRDPAVFLRGIGHFQLEAVWGGSSDTAATLRGTCALALVNCRLADDEILTRLVDLLADAEKPARIDAVRAIAQLGRPEGALLLRLKALAGDREPEVVGWCFESLLSFDAPDAISFVARFLDAKDPEIFLEAVAALGASREPEALECLKNCWSKTLEPDNKCAILTALGASPLPAAAEFLLTVASEGPAEFAASAVAALGASRFCSEVRGRVAAIAAQDPELGKAFGKAFGEILWS